MARYDAQPSTGMNNSQLTRISKQILEGKLTSSDCLCHGSLGNWLALKSIASDQPQIEKIRTDYLHRVVARILREGARSGVLAGQLDSMGLMLGEAGWLIALTIALHPEIPNPLLLELPKATDAARAYAFQGACIDAE